MPNMEFANARAKALEINILGQDRINRLLDSLSPNDALKVLSEVGFGDGTVIDNVMNFEQLLYDEKNKLFNFVRTTCDDNSLKEFILCKSDFHNAEAFIKAKHLGIDVSFVLDVDGIFSKDFLKDKIMTDDYGSFPNSLAQALITCDGDFVEKKATGESVNNLFEKAYFSHLQSVCKKNKHLKELYDVKADCVNVGIALRSRDFIKAQEFFVPFGKVSLSELQLLCEGQLEEIKLKFKFNYIGEFIAKAIDERIKGKPLSSFENLSESFAVEYVKKDRYATEGIMPFMQYCFYKLSDINNVRIILVGLINKLDKANVRQRLRAFYEG